MKKYTFLIVVFVFQISCSDVKHKTSNKDVGFFNQISMFDKMLIEHFPKTVKGKYQTFISENCKYDVAGAMLLNRYDINEFKKNRDYLLKQSIEYYNPKDSCLLVVNMFTNESNFFLKNKATINELEYLDKKCLDSKMPIPNFWPIKIDSKSSSKLPIDYNIYVFGSEKGIINKDFLSMGKYMPSAWKHGFSKGVAINEKDHVIIYWFVIW